MVSLVAKVTLNIWKVENFFGDVRADSEGYRQQKCWAA
jgi:hypothetical protein